jgi:hypothetical protein
MDEFTTMIFDLLNGGNNVVLRVESKKSYNKYFDAFGSIEGFSVNKKNRRITLSENGCELVMFFTIPLNFFEISHRYLYVEEEGVTVKQINKVIKSLSKVPVKLCDITLRDLLIERLIRERTNH